MTQNLPKVWLAVIFCDKGKVLLWKRKGTHGNWTRWFPWWHLEFGETPEECAVRESLEEIGIQPRNTRRIWYTNDFFVEEEKHYVTLFIATDYSGETIILWEPDKCEKWEWFHRNDLPNDLFLPIQNMIKQWMTPFNNSSWTF